MYMKYFSLLSIAAYCSNVMCSDSALVIVSNSLLTSFQSPKYPSITMPSPRLLELASFFIFSIVDESVKSSPFKLTTLSAKSTISLLSVVCQTIFISSEVEAPKSNRGT